MTPSDVEIERALAAITASLNDQRVEDFDTGKVQQLVDESIGGQGQLTIDDGGGVHDPDGRRIGAIRRTPSGEWITERQNPAAERSDAAIPSVEKRSGLLGKLKRSAAE
jgi:hypothetical protein